MPTSCPCVHDVSEVIASVRQLMARSAGMVNLKRPQVQAHTGQFGMELGAAQTRLFSNVFALRPHGEIDQLALRHLGVQPQLPQQTGSGVNVDAEGGASSSADARS